MCTLTLQLIFCRKFRWTNGTVFRSKYLNSDGVWRISGLFIVVHIPKKEQCGNRYSLKRLRQADREDIFLTLSFVIQQDTEISPTMNK